MVARPRDRRRQVRHRRRHHPPGGECRAPELATRSGATSCATSRAARIDEVSKHPICDKAYACSSALNYKHQLFAWLSLFTVGFADLYVRLCSMGIWTDFRIF